VAGRWVVDSRSPEYYCVISRIGNKLVCNQSTNILFFRFPAPSLSLCLSLSLSSSVSACVCLRGPVHRYDRYGRTLPLSILSHVVYGAMKSIIDRLSYLIYYLLNVLSTANRTRLLFGFQSRNVIAGKHWNWFSGPCHIATDPECYPVFKKCNANAIFITSILSQEQLTRPIMHIIV